MPDGDDAEVEQAILADEVPEQCIAFVATAVIAGRHASVPEWLPWTVGGAFALVAGFPISMAILGVIETLAILVLVATVVMVSR